MTQPIAIGAPPIDRLVLDALRAELPGRVLTPEDSGYDAARSGYSLADTPSPHVVVRASSARDIIAAVNFARDQQLPIGVKATGHNFGFPWPGGLMIATEGMQGVTIDVARQTARVEAGVRWRSVIAAAHPYGLAPLSGSSGDVGVVGYTLSGGLGWLLRKYGAAVDSVRSVELVTADGTLRHVSATSEPDLFWALRGGGGNFGVVTTLEFNLYPVRTVYGGALFFPIERAADVLQHYQQWAERSPEALTSAIVLLRVPPLPQLPASVRGRAVVSIRAAYDGTQQEGEALLEPLRALGGPLLDTFQQLPYTAIDTIASEPPTPLPARRATMLLSDLGSAVATLLEIAGAAALSPITLIEIRQLGGAMTHVAADSTAFSQRDAAFLLQLVDVVPTAARAELAERNVRLAAAALRPHATDGVLPGWLGGGDYGEQRTRAGYAPGHYQRLALLKRRYDPHNLFRLNHNIPPLAAPDSYV